MIDQFKKVLKTPKASTSQILNRTQDLILNTFQEIMPSTFNIQAFHQIYKDVFGVEILLNNSIIQITYQQQITFNYRLTDYLISSIKQHFVPLEVYKNLEDQTQRAQENIRGHIKLEQQMKMYMQYLQAKIQKLNKQLGGSNQFPENTYRQIALLQTRQAILQKQKISLMKRNEKLSEDVQLLEIKLEGLKTYRKQQESYQKYSVRSTINKNLFTDRPHITKNQQNLLNQSDLKQENTHNTSKLTQSQRQRQIQKEKEMKEKVNLNLNFNLDLSNHNYELTKKKKSNYFPGKI